LSLETLTDKFRTNALATLDQRAVQRIADQILDTRSRGELSALLDLVLT
jgi:hypothetical protein